VARLMIFVERPRHVGSDEAESWLEHELAAFDGNGVARIQLKRLVSGSLRFAETWSWMVQIDCDDVEAARDALGNGPAMMLLGDLRLLGMRPSVALVEDGS
jgi:hypothetical protein